MAIEVGHKLATQNIYSKIISVPSQELFEKQPKIIERKKMLSELAKPKVKSGFGEPIE